MYSLLGYMVRHKQEGLEGIECGVQESQLSTLAECGFYVVY